MLVIAVLFSLLSKTISDNIICLSCNHVPMPQDCNRVVMCGSHEFCYVEKFVTPDGHVYYDIGCRDNDTCSSTVGRRSNAQPEYLLQRLTKQSRGTLDTSLCHGCCRDGDICNVDGMCGSPALQRKNGTICYNCASIEKPENCNFITLCSSSQMCTVQQKSTALSQRVLYSSGCESRTICAETSNEDCCEGDMCNSKFRCKLQLKHPPILRDPIVTHFGDVKFRCSFDITSHNTAEKFEVTWTVDGIPLTDHQNRPISQMLHSTEREAVLDSYALEENMNKMLRCKVQPYCDTNKSSMDGLQSNGYWVGMKISPMRLGMQMSETVRIESTLPIVCSDGISQNCSPLIKLNDGKGSNSSCQYKLTQESSGVYAANISVKIKVHSFLPIHDRLEFEPLKSLRFPAWNPYNFNTIQLDTFRQNVTSRKCVINGEHLTKFEQSTMVNDVKGYIEMYKSNGMEVQVKRVLCGTSTCACAVVVRANHTGVQIDVCNQTQIVPIIKYLSEPHIAVSQTNDGKLIQVTSVPGHVVTLDVSDGPDLHVTVYKNPNNTAVATGLCKSTQYKIFTKENSLFDKFDIPYNASLSGKYNHCYCNSSSIIVCNTDI